MKVKEQGMERGGFHAGNVWTDNWKERGESDDAVVKDVLRWDEKIITGTQEERRKWMGMLSGLCGN